MSTATELKLEIPEYLKIYTVEQDASLYTPMDQATWRFIMKLSKYFFSQFAQQKYIEGLKETGILEERIPLISEMDVCLSKFGWRAVAVSGFIPPAIFMEFLARGILPIACDMRRPEHLSYTPAPDIVHEAAGHAPIIADPDYARYLKHYGKLAEKAIFSLQDLDVYQAVRNLSEVKEDTRTKPEDISNAQKKLDDALSRVDHVTEAAQLSRMGWWTIEYGLVGSMENPKIYGAGLLSSVSESFHCFDRNVKKIPFSLQCVDTSFDITRPQPQLFVSPDFETLKRGLDLFAEKMAFRVGGREGLSKALKAKTTTTAVLDSGIQISGTLEYFYENEIGDPIFLKFLGPTQVSYENKELNGHGPQYHNSGFSTPLGVLSTFGKGPEAIERVDLERLGFQEKGILEFESGIQLEGRLVEIIKMGGKIILMTFENCTIRQGVQVLFRPEWGRFDLACGTKVVSVFGGAADRDSYLKSTGGFQQKPRSQMSNLTVATIGLCELYGRVRSLREDESLDQEFLVQELVEIQNLLGSQFPSDWLLTFEILEILKKKSLKVSWEEQLRKRLDTISSTSQEKSELIRRGLETL